MNIEAENNKKVVHEYIQTIWNQRKIESIDRFIADDYVDHSFVPAVPPTKNGLKFWIRNISEAFEHVTTIESIVAEGDEVAIRLSFAARHIGKWRNIEATNRKVKVKGFRVFKLRESKIIAHWALLDGESLQSALTDKEHGCTLPD